MYPLQNVEYSLNNLKYFRRLLQMTSYSKNFYFVLNDLSIEKAASDFDKGIYSNYMQFKKITINANDEKNYNTNSPLYYLSLTVNASIIHYNMILNDFLIVLVKEIKNELKYKVNTLSHYIFNNINTRSPNKLSDVCKYILKNIIIYITIKRLYKKIRVDKILLIDINRRKISMNNLIGNFISGDIKYEY
jgi:hypothetical protein